MPISDADLLARLHAAGDDFISGQALAHDAGITRAALAKRIGRLRQRGHVIEGKPSRGYRLVARAKDELSAPALEAAVAPCRLGATVHYHSVTGSTNADLMDLARAGAPEGVVVVADRQTAGRGRLGRRWESPPGGNLYMSVLLRPPATLSPSRAPSFTLAAGVALARTVRAVTGLTPQLKWPNDVLLGGKKAAGILIEMTSDQECVRELIVGIGINVNIRSSEFPDEVRTIATSLCEHGGRSYSRVELAAALLRELASVYEHFLAPDGLAPLLAEWERWAQLAGRRVEATTTTGPVVGEALGLDAEGRLLVRPDGQKTPLIITAGDLAVLD